MNKRHNEQKDQIFLDFWGINQKFISEGSVNKGRKQGPLYPPRTHQAAGSGQIYNSELCGNPRAEGFAATFATKKME